MSASIENIKITIYTETSRLILFRNLLKDPLVDKVRKIIMIQAADMHTDDTSWETLFFQVCGELIEIAEREGVQGNLWQNYLLRLITGDENPFSRNCARAGLKGNSNSLVQAAVFDIEILRDFFHLDLDSLGENKWPRISGILNNFVLPEALSYPRNPYQDDYFRMLALFQTNSSADYLVQELAEYYHTAGYGISGRFISFRWDHEQGLIGIKYPDPIVLEDLIGYERQKELVIKNTEAFIQGKKANNILLYGDRGTGKSSTIKALINRYYLQGLRLVEVAKNQIPEFLEVVRSIREQPQRFIIFIDDLSFEGSETEYKHLKYLMEGGMEVVPENVLVYATSNRRHLVQETWVDREQLSGEIHAADAVAEKLSLADRFGMTITFTSPAQEEYLQIVEGLADRKDVKIPRGELRERALQWASWYNGRSGRTASQFVNSILAGMEGR